MVTPNSSRTIATKLLKQNYIDAIITKIVKILSLKFSINSFPHKLCCEIITKMLFLIFFFFLVFFFFRSISLSKCFFFFFLEKGERNTHFGKLDLLFCLFNRNRV